MRQLSLAPGFGGQIEQRRADALTIAAEPDESADDVTAALRKVEEELDAGKVRLWAIRSAARRARGGAAAVMDEARAAAGPLVVRRR